ncbi:MAG: hypothetical protein ACFE89_06105 [Candidatus Hodarchaeota archaeon]
MLTEDNQISWSEQEELEQIRSQTLRFRWLAADCQTWDEVITAIHEFINCLKELESKGAIIVQNDSDYLFYEIPDEYGVYALYEGVRDDNWVFRLADGSLISYPVDSDDAILQNTPIGTRITVLLNSEKQIQCFHVSFHQPRIPVDKED